MKRIWAFQKHYNPKNLLVSKAITETFLKELTYNLGRQNAESASDKMYAYAWGYVCIACGCVFVCACVHACVLIWVGGQLCLLVNGNIDLCNESFSSISFFQYVLLLYIAHIYNKYLKIKTMYLSRRDIYSVSEGTLKKESVSWKSMSQCDLGSPWISKCC